MRDWKDQAVHVSVHKQHDLLEGQQPPLQRLDPGGGVSWGLLQELLVVSAVKLPEGHLTFNCECKLCAPCTQAGQ